MTESYALQTIDAPALTWVVQGDDAEDPRWLMWAMARRAWLDAKARKSGGPNTVAAYAMALDQFQRWSPVPLWAVSSAVAQEFAHALETGLAVTYHGPVVVNTRTRRIHHPTARCAPAERYCREYPTRAAAEADGAILCRACAPELGQGHPLSQASVNQKVAALSSFYQFIQRQYAFRAPDGREIALWPADRANPWAAVERAEVDMFTRAVYPSTEDVQAILSVINQDTITGARDYALIYAFVVTCRRSREILTLRWGQIEPAGDGYKMRYVYKGGAIKRAPIQREVYQIIVDYLQACGRWPLQPDDLVFVALDEERAARLPGAPARPAEPRPLSNSQVNRMLKRYARLAGVDEHRAHLHGLRHAGARMRVQAGERADTMKEFLGHRHVGTTEIYINVVCKDPADPSGAAAAATFRVARKRGRPQKNGEQPALFDPDEKPKKGQRK